MFKSRVMGVGAIVLPKELWFDDTLSIGKFEMDQANAQNEYNRKLTAWTVGLNAARSQCPPIDPNIRFIQAPTCQAIEDYERSNPMPVKPDVDVYDALKQRELESQKAVKDAQSWRSNTPIASWTSANASGVARTINVYGYNKEIGYVWLAEGPNSSAANSQLFPEFVLAAKSPEWVAAKASLGSSSGGGSALPLLLGAAYLLLA